MSPILKGCELDITQSGCISSSSLLSYYFPGCMRFTTFCIRRAIPHADGTCRRLTYRKRMQVSRLVFQQCCNKYMKTIVDPKEQCKRRIAKERGCQLCNLQSMQPRCTCLSLCYSGQHTQLIFIRARLMFAVPAVHHTKCMLRNTTQCHFSVLLKYASALLVDAAHRDAAHPQPMGLLGLANS